MFSPQSAPVAWSLELRHDPLTGPIIYIYCHYYPEFLADEVAVEVVDDVGILVLLHHDDLVDDEFLLRLLRQIHLFDGDLATRRHLYGNVHSSRRPGVKGQNIIHTHPTIGQCSQFQTPWCQRSEYYTPTPHHRAMFTVSDALGSKVRVLSIHPTRFGRIWNFIQIESNILEMLNTNRISNIQWLRCRDVLSGRAVGGIATIGINLFVNFLM